jgi:hypothetical protein
VTQFRIPHKIQIVCGILLLDPKRFLLLQGNFYILALVFLPLLVITVLLLAMSIIVATTKSLAGSELSRFVLGSGIRIGAGILILVALALGSLYFASGPTSLPARSPTPAMTVHPSTTVTPSPLDFTLQPPEPGSAASQTLAFVIILVIALVIPFTSPGAWTSRNLRDVSIGFVGWFLANTLLWIQVVSSIAQSSGAEFFQLERIRPLLVNMMAIDCLEIAMRRGIEKSGEYNWTKFVILIADKGHLFLKKHRCIV